MAKTQIGLGVLAIPVVFDTLGLAGGIICLVIIAMVTTWSGYVVGIFKNNHPEVYGIDDAGRKIAGKPGYIILGSAFCLCKCSRIEGEVTVANTQWTSFSLPALAC